MKLQRMERRRHPETIVALIDVVFFLLVFFMLVGRFDATAPFDVTPTISTIGAPLPAGGYTISISEDGRLALDGRETTPSEAITELSEARTADGALFVRLNAHAAAPVRELLPVIVGLDEIGVEDVVVVVTPSPP